MKCRVAALALGLLAIPVGASGCGEEVGRPTVSSKALDRRVFALQPGTSADAVRAQLGEPVSEISLDEEDVLYYGRWQWQLAFTDKGLETRTREYKPGRWAKGESKALDRKVFALQPGTSIRAVRALLGHPESLQIYANAPAKEESLWYGQWKLSFTDGRLEARTKF